MKSSKSGIPPATAPATSEQIKEESRTLNAALEQRVAHRTALVQLLQDVAVAANEASTVGTVLQFAVDRVCGYTGWPVGHAYWPDREREDLLAPTNIWHVDQAEQFKTFQQVTGETCFTRGSGLPGRVLATGQPAWIIDVTKEPDFARAQPAEDIGVKAGFAFPVLAGPEVVAVLEFFSDQAIEPDPSLLEAMAHIGTQLGRVVERKQAEEQIQAMNRELEQRISDRTAQLEASNQALAAEVAERKQAEAALEAQHAFLRQVIDLNPNFIFAKDRQGRFTLVNQTMAESYGTTVEALIGKTDADFHPNIEEVEGFRQSDRDVIETRREKFTPEQKFTKATGQAQWLQTVKRPLLNDAGRVEQVLGVSTDITALKRTEQAQRLLAEVGDILAASVDYSDRLANVARIAVPDLADWCAVDVIEADESVNRLAIAHVDSAKMKLAQDLQRCYPPDWNAPSRAPHVLRTGQAELYPDITEEMLQNVAHDAEHLQILRRLGMQSAMIVPLIARGRPLGAMTFVWAESGRRYDEADLALAEELARRAALAVDNARLYAEAQRLNITLEQRVQDRTAALQAANTHLKNEMAERKQIEVKIRESERRLAEAQQIAHIGSWSWDIPANELTWSDELYRIYGLRPRALKATYEEFLKRVHPRDRNAVRRVIEQAFEDHHPFVFEHRIVRPDETIGFLQARGKVILDDNEQPVKMVGTGQDITDRRRAEEALRRSEARFRAITEGAAIGIALTDLKKRIIESNPALRKMLGYSQEDLRRMLLTDLTHPADAQMVADLYRELVAGQRDHYQVEKRYWRRDRRLVWTRATVSLVRGADDTPQFAIAMLEDITDQKQMESELAEVRRRLIESREAERLHLAQELHDGPLQDLAGVSFRLGEIETVLPDETSLGQLAASLATLQQTTQTLRAICGELRPPALAPFGLEKAIRSHVENFQKANPALNIQLDLTADGQSLPEQVRLALFRIYQQALNNVKQHAGAGRATIRFRLEPAQVILEIEDDGCGFKTPRRLIELARQGHLGLVGAAERAEAVGGCLKIAATPDQGTLIQAVVPRSESPRTGQEE